MTLDALGLERPHLAGWSGGGAALIEFAAEYPDRVRSLTLVEPAAYWILEQLGERLAEIERGNSFVHGLFGRAVTEDDLATFLQLAGLVENAQDAPSHPNWDRWVTHRTTLSWLGEKVDHPDRSVQELASITCPVLLTKGTRTGDLDKRVVDVLGQRLPNASVVELEGDHAHHIQSIDAFMRAFEAHLSRTEAPRIA